jgi:phosphoribosylformylglycinamidine cyclo-ligase
MKLGVTDPFPGEDSTVAGALLRIHRSYLPALRPVLGRIRAMAHITGGGLPGNLNRALPAHLDARVDAASWTVPNVFAQLQRAGDVPTAEMFRAFNMGVGMVVIVAPDDADAVLASAAAAGVPGWRLGQVVAGSGRVDIQHVEAV